MTDVRDLGDLIQGLCFIFFRHLGDSTAEIDFAVDFEGNTEVHIYCSDKVYSTYTAGVTINYFYDGKVGYCHSYYF
jgi:hypothetical protein